MKAVGGEGRIMKPDSHETAIPSARSPAPGIHRVGSVTVS